MSDFSIENTAKCMLRARMHNMLVNMDDLSHLSETDGYAVQKEIIRCKEQNQFGNLVGWKIGASSDAAQKVLGYGPFYGPLFEKNFVSINEVVDLKSLGGEFIAAEVEVAFELNQGISPKDDGLEYSIDEVWGCVENVIPAIELAATRLEGKRTHGATAADFALNGCVLMHDKINRALFANPESLASIIASLDVDSVEKTRGNGTNVMGNPINALTWLVNSLLAKNISLRKGDVVLSGCIVMTKDVSAGSVLTAHMGNFHTPALFSDIKFELITI